MESVKASEYKRVEMKLILSLITSVAIFSMLVPSSVVAQSEFKVFVIGGGIHEVDLRATQDANGQEAAISSFVIRPESVVQVKQNEPLQIFTSTNEPQRVEKIKLTNSLGQTFDLQGTTLQGIAPGVYTLDVIVNLPTGGKGAYETVLVVLSPLSQEQANPTQVITQTQKTDVKVIFKDNPKKKDNLRLICGLVPSDPRCDPKNGKCPKGFATNEDGHCFPTGKCPSGYHRANDDETGRCVPERDLKRCEDGSWAYKDDQCPEDWPQPIVCDDGSTVLEGEPCPEPVVDETLPPCSLVAPGETCDNTEDEDSWTDEEVEEEDTEESEESFTEDEEDEDEPEEEAEAEGGDEEFG